MMGQHKTLAFRDPAMGAKNTWLILLGLVTLGAAGLGWLSVRDRGASETISISSSRQGGASHPSRLAIPALQGVGYSDVGRVLVEESGWMVLHQHFPPKFKDPFSMTEVRDYYLRAGSRGAEIIQEEMAGQPHPTEESLRQLTLQAQLYLYEGDFVRAAEILAEVRRLGVTQHVKLPYGLPTIIFLQGIAALRRGETENCVECNCNSSCIFPLQPQAFHTKKEGSRQAIHFFTEFLERHPGEDIGVRWLLNLAYMTLGEYPDQVPPRYLLPPALFRSELDAGRFTDIAAMLGVNPLNCAGGAVMEDFRNCGLLDIVVTTCDPTGTMVYFKNRGDGTFEECGKAAGLADQLGGLYCVQTDYNNDGWKDLFICRGAWTGIPQRPTLLRNNGDGTFTDVTKEAGLMNLAVSQVAAWADYDNDGWLDLYVGDEQGNGRLYHNRGDGTFEDVTEKAGVATPGVLCKGANWADFNGDRYPDLYVSNLNGPPRLFRNNRDGTFTDVAKEMGITLPTNGFSCWFWDYDNDGWPDLFVGAYDRNLNRNILSLLGDRSVDHTCRLYHNEQGRGFRDVTKEVGLDIVTSPMGSNFLDIDNDGFLDIYLGTGAPNYSMLVPNRMFKNIDGKRFVDITYSSGTGQLQKGHAVAAGDWDRDGNVDMYVQLGGFTPGDRFRNALFQNPGHKNHWITVKLVGQKTNRAAIGARIKVQPAGENARPVYRYVTNGSSFGGSPLQQTIGIGKADKIAALEIYWPTSDTTQVFRDLAVDQAVEITEFAKAYRPLAWTRLPGPKAAASGPVGSE
jgi:hypothetical protein